MSLTEFESSSLDSKAFWKICQKETETMIITRNIMTQI